MFEIQFWEEILDGWWWSSSGWGRTRRTIYFRIRTRARNQLEIYSFGSRSWCWGHFYLDKFFTRYIIKSSSWYFQEQVWFPPMFTICRIFCRSWTTFSLGNSRSLLNCHKQQVILANWLTSSVKDSIFFHRKHRIDNGYKMQTSSSSTSNRFFLSENDFHKGYFLYEIL